MRYRPGVKDYKFVATDRAFGKEAESDAKHRQRRWQVILPKTLELVIENGEGTVTIHLKPGTCMRYDGGGEV